MRLAAQYRSQPRFSRFPRLIIISRALITSYFHAPLSQGLSFSSRFISAMILHKIYNEHIHNYECCSHLLQRQSLNTKYLKLTSSELLLTT